MSEQSSVRSAIQLGTSHRQELALVNIPPAKPRLEDAHDIVEEVDENDEFEFEECFEEDNGAEFDAQIDEYSYYEEETIADGLSTVWEETSKDLQSVVGASDIRSVASFDTRSVTSRSRSSRGGGRKLRSGKRPSKNNGTANTSTSTSTSTNTGTTPSSLDSFFERDKKKIQHPAVFSTTQSSAASPPKVSLDSFFSEQRQHSPSRHGCPRPCKIDAEKTGHDEPSDQSQLSGQSPISGEMIALMTYLTGEQVWRPVGGDLCNDDDGESDGRNFGIFPARLDQSDDEYTFVSCTTEGTETVSYLSTGVGDVATATAATFASCGNNVQSTTTAVRSTNNNHDVPLETGSMDDIIDGMTNLTTLGVGPLQMRNNIMESRNRIKER